jgi:hypothetical protein
MLEIISKAKNIYEIVFNAANMEEDTNIPEQPSDTNVKCKDKLTPLQAYGAQIVLGG